MTVTRRARPKPTASAEVARVLQIFDMLAGELSRRQPYGVVTKDGKLTQDTLVPIKDITILPPNPDGNAILATAERIAARTEGI